MFKFLQSLLVIAAILFAILISWPSLIGLQREPFFAQAVSMRGLLALGALGLIIVLILLALFARPLRKIIASFCLILLGFAAFNAFLVWSKGMDNPPASALELHDPDALTVMAWNTLGGKPGAETIAQHAINLGAEVISLPETTLEMTQDIAERLRQAGMPMQVFHRALNQSAAAKSTGLLISTTLGEYRLNESSGDTSQLPSVIAVSDTGPTIVAVHAVAPIGDYLPGWQSDLSWLAAQCQNDDTILAGDFNATLDHFIGLGVDGADLGNCLDAAQERQVAGHGTWPSNLPTEISLPIDHILAGKNWTPSFFRVSSEFDQSGSDHRPIVAKYLKKSELKN